MVRSDVLCSITDLGLFILSVTEQKHDMYVSWVIYIHQNIIYHHNYYKRKIFIMGIYSIDTGILVS